jgi:type I restriction enzyme, S subunit
MRIAWVPLKSVVTVRASNVDKKTVEGDQPVRLCNYTDVYYNNTISVDMTFVPATATQEQVRVFGLRKDDVVITKDSETAEDIGIAAYVKSSDRDLVCGYHLAILRPNHTRIHGRFLFWSLMSRHLRDQFAISATGVTRFGLRTESIASSKVALCSLEKQVVIADFLDAETGRIDALIAKKVRLIA